ncbi:MAG: glutamine synthetase III [Oscillospiraceae bacterium]|nr:glutamine synthetase III [Oscillospiraceae bacterium]
MKLIPELFGSMVFNDAVMRERLPTDIYEALKKTMQEGSHLKLEVANHVAAAMKDWATEKGATHYTHWFQPMTGITAEKHNGFVTPGEDGKAIMAFSGKSLVRGESDASSFPSGGLRATFEARGYTVWDTTSYAFIKDGSLCIPTAFCSYSGEALDKKTPLLRSMEALDKQAVRVLRLFGDTKVKKVTAQVGAEQEYFLIDKDVYLKRPDLVYTGRTLFGASPPKGQELGEHYFGSLKPRVAAFMNELDDELWRLGVFAKTKHNETAPAQHELATVYSTANIATDHNQITMEVMRIVANRHNLACLLHEKPFKGVSGSGKHNNWSLSSDDGTNLLNPGKTPGENPKFLLFLTAVIKAVSQYRDVLRASAASADNDHRLGADEAPPAIMSIFLGEELTAILDSFEKGKNYRDTERVSMETGVTALPHFLRDKTDRNRTSPFAFTGNKFEFRMLGSASSVAEPNIALNTAVAEVLREFADELEGCDDLTLALDELIKRTYKEHKRIVFNGDNYSEEWLVESKQRGLSNIKSTVDALEAYVGKNSVALFAKHGVFTENELKSRYEILMESYCKTVRVEALTMLDLTRGEIIPACIRYQNELAGLLKQKGEINKLYNITSDCELEKYLLKSLSDLSAKLLQRLTALEMRVNEYASNLGNDGVCLKALFCRDKIYTAMSELREVADEIEALTAKSFQSLPSYGEMLFSVC